MAIGWLTVLKLVPWGDVISNAPRIADGAKKLWSTVAKKPMATSHPLPSVRPGLSSAGPSSAELQAQLDAALSEIASLHHQMLESSELIKALADQNTQLVKRVELNRIRLLWLAGVVVVFVVISVINLVRTL